LKQCPRGTTWLFQVDDVIIAQQSRQDDVMLTRESPCWRPPFWFAEISWQEDSENNRKDKEENKRMKDVWMYAPPAVQAAAHDLSALFSLKWFKAVWNYYFFLFTEGSGWRGYSYSVTKLHGLLPFLVISNILVTF
jgi:hypothetical protein